MTTVAQTKKEVAVVGKVVREDKIKKESTNDSLTDAKSALYVVQNGDNIITIAEKYKVTVAQLKEWNNLTEATLSLGSSLQIAFDSKETVKLELAQSPELKEIQYTVQKGDNLGTIAKKFGATVENLKEWNGLTSANITLGRELIVAKDEIAIATNAVAVSTFKLKNTSKVQESYYVKKGDSLYSIAKKYPGITVSDIKKWNGIKEENIKPGMKLKING
jgi:membrane-bound lytic murein transglycosylase D